MATSSFDKEFILDSKRAIKSFIKIITEEPKPMNVDRSLTSPETRKRGEERLMQLLSRCKDL